MNDGDYPSVKRPSRRQVEELAADLGLSLTEEELADHATLLDGALDDVQRVLELPDPAFGIHSRQYTTRPSGFKPRGNENPLNVWITKCRVDGAETGPLSGVTVGLKDNIALAGYEMTCGSRVLRGYVPQIDATVVSRLLEAGATITGKLNMEGFAWSGSSDISDFGTVPNPHDTDYLAGGSSSGSGGAVALGECDVALGGDQGGSIRIPAAWCGVVGLKPTTGLIPYTGIFPLDPSIDHVGPLTRTVEEAAITTSVLAGEDVQNAVKMDPRQPVGVEPADYEAAVDEDVSGLTVGVLEGGFDWDVADQDINDTVRETIAALEREGVDTMSVSVDYHQEILSLITPMEIQGGHRLVQEDGVGSHHPGWYWTDLIDVFGEMKDARADELPPTAKNSLLVGAYLAEEYGIEVYAKAKNVILELRRQYDELLEACDALVMPTVPIHPYERDPSLSRQERVGRIVENHRNTAAFDHTHHPALTVPCGTVDGLPVGIQLVGAHFDERTLFRIGATVENVADSPSIPVYDG